MKYAIIADVHGNLEALEAVLADARARACTHYCCLGDVVGLGPNPRECLEVVRQMGMPCVRGEYDESSSTEDELEGFNPAAVESVRWTRGQLPPDDKQWLRELKLIRLVGSFTLVHATLDQPHRWAGVFDKLMAAASFIYQNTSVCFFGHTHVPTAFVRDAVVRGGTYSKFRVEPGRKYFVNVCSVGQPSDGNPKSGYAVYDLDESSIELCRLDYDIPQTQAKIRAAGLPARLADGLAFGKGEAQPWNDSFPRKFASPRPEPPPPAPATGQPSVWQRIRSWGTRPPQG